MFSSPSPANPWGGGFRASRGGWRSDLRRCGRDLGIGRPFLDRQASETWICAAGYGFRLETSEGDPYYRALVEFIFVCLILCSFENCTLICRQVKDGVLPGEVVLDSVDMWVQLYDLPLGYTSYAILEQIGNFLAIFVKSDDHWGFVAQFLPHSCFNTSE